MNYPSIRIEGSILSPDILEKLEESNGQRPADFGLEATVKVKDEIARAWADAQDYWRIYNRKLETIKEDSPATTETRNLWVVPLLGLLGYQLEYEAKSIELNSKLYPISHRVTNRDNAAIQIVGSREPAGLDRKAEKAALKMSAHAMMQEYLNLTEQLYGIVTNGKLLRLLRDSSRLVKLTYLEFDLDRIFSDGLFADFAVLYRLLHVSRLPAQLENSADSIIERYHQDSLDSGARIRDGLSKAVENAIRTFANGFLSHPSNHALRDMIAANGEQRAVSGGNQQMANGEQGAEKDFNCSPLTAHRSLTPQEFYSYLLRLIYRLLFLMVIEERNLVYPLSPSATKRDIYDRYYSLMRLRRLSEKRYLADKRHDDHWLALLATFQLFEDGGPGSKLGIAPLAGDLFRFDAIGPFGRCSLDNETLLQCLRSLSLYENPNNGQVIRVNYAALNVEEFGSVYEGLLEYEPVFLKTASGEWRAASGGITASSERRVVSGENQTPLATYHSPLAINHLPKIEFAFARGDERAATGSHYTPDDLVQPLIKHSLDYLIADKLEESRRVANGEWRVVEETWKCYFRKEIYGILSGSGSMAAGYESGGIRIQIDEIISKGGNVRAHQPDSTVSGFNTGQHSRGMGTTDAKGIPAISPYSQWQSPGTGNTPAALQKGGNMLGGTNSATYQRDNHFEQTDSGTATLSLTESQLAEIWVKSPLATRHSLLASQALLSLRVADISCGSGHILLAAARRIATELAVVRTGEEQPSPGAYRTAVRDVICNCIYGVDLNPLAVELCKVALWLEAHIPGQPLNFLDHHIKCGNAIVGFARREELERGVPDEAFATMPGDDKEIAASFRKRNKEERQIYEKRLGKQESLVFTPEVEKHLAEILKGWRTIAALPEHNPAEIEAKKKRYQEFAGGQDSWLLSQIAAIPVAQFYIEKLKENQPKLITDEEYRRYLDGHRTPQGQATAMAWALANRKRFFNWFLEFPEIIEQGGFDCILGNPPYLHGQKLSGTYGLAFCEWVKWEYAPAGVSDLVAYFVRRIFSLLRQGGFTSFITTNSIKDGDIRQDSLEQVLVQGGNINFAVRSIKWPGRANVIVSLVGIHKGKWDRKCNLDGKDVSVISPFFEDSMDIGEPIDLIDCADHIYQGSIFLGNGFLLTHEEADKLVQFDQRNTDVIFPVINGQEINNKPDQIPGRSIINFFDWDIQKAQQYEGPFSILEDKVKPFRATQNRARNRDIWWIYAEHRPGLNRGIRPLKRCFVAAATTKYLNFSAAPTNYVFLNTLFVFTTDRWDLYSVVQSGLHEVWARKYSGALKQDLRYSPSKCFETFPLPSDLWHKNNLALATIGEDYHEYRRALMLRLWLGLTDIYNLFHNRDLTPAIVAKVSGKPEEAEAGYQGILELRKLHRELDDAVLAAYGWGETGISEIANSEIENPQSLSPYLPISLNHNFYEVETLAENDRVRYTISPDARKELLKRLLALNHQRAAEEKAKAPVKAEKAGKGKAAKGKKAAADEPGLFG